jgi:hypothetical protein
MVETITQLDLNQIRVFKIVFNYLNLQKNW